MLDRRLAALEKATGGDRAREGEEGKQPLSQLQINEREGAEQSCRGPILDQEWPPSAGEISRCRGQGTADIGKKRLGVMFSIGAKACWGVCVGLHVDAYVYFIRMALACCAPLCSRMQHMRQLQPGGAPC